MTQYLISMNTISLLLTVFEIFDFKLSRVWPWPLTSSDMTSYLTSMDIISLSLTVFEMFFFIIFGVNPRTPRRGGCYHPLPFFPCNIFDDSNRKNRLIVSVTRDGRHVLAYVTSSWRCHVTYVMTSNVHDGGQKTLFLPLFVNRDIFWCRWDEVIRLVSFSTKSRSWNPKMLKQITWPWRMTLKLEVKLSSTCPFVTGLVIMMQS